MIEPPCTERYARWCERSASQLMGSLLLDYVLIINCNFYRHLWGAYLTLIYTSDIIDTSGWENPFYCVIFSILYEKGLLV